MISHTRRPASFRDLLLWLACHPRVSIKSRLRERREVDFVAYSDGVLHWSDGAYHAICCQMKRNAERAETGLEFDAAGFTLEKHGFKIRFDYMTKGTDR